MDISVAGPFYAATFQQRITDCLTERPLEICVPNPNQHNTVLTHSDPDFAYTLGGMEVISAQD